MYICVEIGEVGINIQGPILHIIQLLPGILTMTTMMNEMMANFKGATSRYFVSFRQQPKLWFKWWEI